MSVLPASYLSSPFAENAEVSVVLCPVGPTATACQAAMPLLPQIAKFTRVPLRDARKFYSPDHKSPFPGIPWETGHIKYRCGFVGPSARRGAPVQPHVFDDDCLMSNDV